MTQTNDKTQTQNKEVETKTENVSTIEQGNAQMMKALEERMKILDMRDKIALREQNLYSPVNAEEIEDTPFIYGSKISKEAVNQFKEGYNNKFKELNK